MCSEKNVVIIGYGYVGQSVHASLSTIKDININIIDKDQNKCYTQNLYNFDDVDYIFICVNTNYNESEKEKFQDFRDSLELLYENKCKSLVVIKSTIPFYSFERITSDLQKKYNHSLNIVVNPEFLNQNSYIDDGLNPKLILMGGDYINTFDLEKMYKQCIFKEEPIYKHCTIKDAINFKFTRNIYGAYKVLFWNYIEDIGANSRLMSELYNLLPQGEMSQVGLDGKLGYGGACFPKDVKNMHREISHELTEFMINYNESLSSD